MRRPFHAVPLRPVCSCWFLAKVWGTRRVISYIAVNRRVGVMAGVMASPGLLGEVGLAQSRLAASPISGCDQLQCSHGSAVFLSSS